MKKLNKSSKKWEGLVSKPEWLLYSEYQVFEKQLFQFQSLTTDKNPSILPSAAMSYGPSCRARYRWLIFDRDEWKYKQWEMKSLRNVITKFELNHLWTEKIKKLLSNLISFLKIKVFLSQCYNLTLELPTCPGQAKFIHGQTEALSWLPDWASKFARRAKFQQ